MSWLISIHEDMTTLFGYYGWRRIFWLCIL
jgi:hypothetical protein